MGDKFIIIGGTVIVATGFLNALINGQPVSRVVFGGIVFVLVLSVIALVGPTAAKIARALVVVALIAVLLNELPGLLAKSPFVPPGTPPVFSGTLPPPQKQ